MHKEDSIEVLENKPHDFNALVEISACYIEIDNRILLLQRTIEKTWGVPAGKLEKGEHPEQGAKRELFEETGIAIEQSSQIKSLGKLFLRKPQCDFVYHMFKVELEYMPQVQLSHEHISYAWPTFLEVKSFNLMAGAQEALNFYRHGALKKFRKGASVNAYLIVRKENEVLLYLRKGTGYCDGRYGLISGHVEEGESATAAIIREAKEEAGINIAPADLKAVHVQHRKSDRLNIDIFFACASWQGEIVNKEPAKCASLDFFPIHHLPENTIPYVNEALQASVSGKFYAENGWE